MILFYFIYIYTYTYLFYKYIILYTVLYYIIHYIISVHSDITLIKFILFKLSSLVMHICENETTWIRSEISLICMRDTQNRRGIAAVLRAHW